MLREKVRGSNPLSSTTQRGLTGAHAVRPGSAHVRAHQHVAALEQAGLLTEEIRGTCREMVGILPSVAGCSERPNP